MQTARGAARIMDILKTIVLKILRFLIHMFPHRTAVGHLKYQQRVDFANESLIYHYGNLTEIFTFYGRTRHISS